MTKQIISPLADRMRPENLENFFGQDEIIGEGRLLRQAIEKDSVPSLIFWGPPGSGKTTLAFIIAKKTEANFVKISAVDSGKKELMEIVKKAQEYNQKGQKTILFIDEIHRWNKTQQDALLPQVEQGLITLIGATTENPSFEVRAALLSRCRVFVLEALKKDQIMEVVLKALHDSKKGLGKEGIEIDEEALNFLAQMSNGDARTALNILDYGAQLSFSPEIQKKEKEHQGKVIINLDIIKEAFQKSFLRYDKDGEEHYNIISALHKAMRGSDADAALYWLARMIEAGEDPLYIARRLIRFASEDIGLANSRALEQAVACYQACFYIGLPECKLALAQAVVYMSKCKKSNALYLGYKKAKEDIKKYGNLSVPLHIRNAPTNLMKNLGYGKNYKYSPDYDYQEDQEYFPEELRGKKYL